LLLVWTYWWLRNFLANHLTGATWVPAYLTLGRDFEHNFLAVHLLAHGGNPYLQNFGDDRGTYAYPPVVLGLFFWCALFPLRLKFAATVLFEIAIAVIVALAARVAWLKRRQWNLTSIPWPLMLAVALFSTPVIFAMERSNCDALVLGLLVLAAHAMNRRTRRADFAAGACLGLAMWIKIYPGLIILAIPALRRWRVFFASVGAGVLIALIFLPATIQFFTTGQQSEGYRSKFLSSALHFSQDPLKAESGNKINSYPPLEPYSHSLPIYWHRFWHLRSPAISRLPGVIGTAFFLGPLLFWVCRRLWMMSDPTPLAYPFLLWVALVATFWMPVSYDYNLIYFPVLFAAIWTATDGWPVHALLIPGLIYWQPLAVNVPMQWLLVFKLMALLALGICLVKRTAGQ
jgi:hypothetical protein